MRFQWLLCGPSERWHRAICRFGPETLPQRRDRLVVNIVAPAQLGHACRQAGGAVILWPLLETTNATDRKAALSTLASLSNFDVRTLDLIEPPDASVSGHLPNASGPYTISPRPVQTQTRIELMQLGGNAVLIHHPQDLDRYAPVIRRFWNSIRPAEEPIESYYV